MIPIEALQALDAIERRGSFAAAAEELYRVPSAITYTIKKLEEQLGINLFDRDKQRARLTPAGKVVLEKGREILLRVQQLEEQAQLAESGWEKELRIVMDTIFPCEPLWPLLQELQQQQPWLNIQILDEALSGSWEALVNGRADVIIGVSGDEPPGGHWLRHRLGNLQMQLCCSPDHPASQLASPIQHEQLKAFTHIVITDSARHLPPRNVGLLGIQQTITVDNLSQKLSALFNGMGISHLPLPLFQTLQRQGKLVPLITHTGSNAQAFYMCWRKDQKGKANQWLREQIIARGVLDHLFEP